MLFMYQKVKKIKVSQKRLNLSNARIINVFEKYVQFKSAIKTGLSIWNNEDDVKTLDISTMAC